MPKQNMEKLNRRKKEILSDSWKKLETDLLASECAVPYLNKICKNLIIGDGNPHAKIMIIGEAPGENEDNTGIPFTGKSGKLLDKLLSHAGLERKNVYITNVLKYRPPNNRKPLPSEIIACKPFLLRQISLINPKLIITLGTVATQTILSLKASLTSLRQKKHKFSTTDIIVITTYHPAYLLRYPENMKNVLLDWEFIKNTCLSI